MGDLVTKMRTALVLLVCCVAASGATAGPVLSSEDVAITLDKALPIALQKAAREFPDLDKYILYSAGPRVLKGDSKGVHWQFTWQEKAFPQYHFLTVRVYMSNGETAAERGKKGTFQQKNDRPLAAEPPSN